MIQVYVLWLREMKRLVRSKSRFFSSLFMPLMFLLFLSSGFSGVKFQGIENYTEYLTPGIAAMAVVFSSTFAGLSVLWDREFGFLKEISVAPVSNTAVVCGRIAGSATTSTLQAMAIVILSIPIGFSTTLYGVLTSFFFAVLMAVTFTGMGLVFASVIKDFHGFGMVMNFVIFPLFFLSGAMFPISKLPSFIRIFAYANPMFYGVSGMRLALISNCLSPAYLLISLFFSVITVLVAARAFERI